MNIRNIFAKSISAKLIAFFLIISLIPIAIIGILSINNASKSLKEREFEQLQTVGEFKSEHVIEYLENLFTPMAVLTKSNDVKATYNTLKSYHDNGGALQNGKFDVSSNQYNNIYNQIDPFFSVFVESFGFDDLYFICAEHGHIMYTSHKDSDLGENLSTGELRDTHLAELWKKVKSTGRMEMVDFEMFKATNTPESFLGAPVLNENGEVLAVVAVEIKAEHLNGIMIDSHGLGETGESYLVGDDKIMRTDSRHETQSTILKKIIDTESVRLGLTEEVGVISTLDYRGVKVLSYYTHLALDNQFNTDFDWVLITEIEEAEALNPVYILEREIIIISILVALAVLVLALFISGYFTKPIKQITAIAESAAIGDFNQNIDISRSDEIGILSKSFSTLQDTMREKAKQAIQISEGDLTIQVEPLSDKDEMGKAFKIMVEQLNVQINEINQVVATLTSSNSQLMSTIAELSSSSSETATTVSEITTTIEEVKQTAEISAQKAKNVSSTAQKSVQYSENGIKATEDSISGMHNIQEQVKQIAETIIKLSEQSQTISNITSSVNDLTDQSNVLAVNASIEAVKAGEYGKGFGVVAQEIRALADQSKQATKQIREILNDVQKAISSAVMATEQGGKAVENGTSLAEASGDSISMLADSISEAARASMQIAASSQQQLTGMEQLGTAMENIKQASNQNAAGTKQAEEAVGNIKSIVLNLTDLIKKYKTK